MIRIAATLLFIAAAGRVEANNDSSKMPPVDARPRVSIVAQEVTLNGEVRADVAQAISDSISSNLIKSGQYRVFQPQAMLRPTRKKRDAAYGAVGGAPEALPLGNVTPNKDSDYVYAFNVLGDQGNYRLTVKKLAAATAEVLLVEETNAVGSLDMLFSAVPVALRQLELRGRVTPRPFPQSQSPAQAREIIRPAVAVQAAYEQSAGLREYYASLSRVPPEFGNMDLKNVPKALIYQPMGAIQAINDAWKFCIIQPQAGHRFAVNQQLDVLYDEDGKPYGTLKVDALDSGKVVAGFGRTPGHHPLFRGDVVYGWAPPLR